MRRDNIGPIRYELFHIVTEDFSIHARERERVFDLQSFVRYGQTYCETLQITIFFPPRLDTDLTNTSQHE